MNKIIIIFLALLIISPVISQNNQGVIIYKKELSSRTNQDMYKEYKGKKPEYYKKILLIEQMSQSLLKDIEFILTFNENECFFTVKDVLEVENNPYYGFAIGPYGSGKYYTNIREEEYYSHLDAYGDKFLIKNPKIHWELFNETKQIGKYVCYKASTIKTTKGRNGIIKTPVTAWYASELTIPFGPIGYGGLPGLILELQINEIKFIVEKIQLNPNYEVVIKKPKGGINVTKDEFEEMGLKTMSEFKKGF